MDNDNNDAKSQAENHRGSVSSSRSLEIPVTPSRSPKKVSFSDELPTTTAAAEAEPQFESQSPAHKPVQLQASGVSHVLHQAAQYLERLHGGSRDHPVEEVHANADSDGDSTTSAAVLDLDATDAAVPTAPAGLVLTSTTSPSILIASDGSKQEVQRQHQSWSQSQPQQTSQLQSNLYMERYNLNLDKNCSSMELEARREKQRWLLISECSALFDEGEGRHTREAFRKLFLDEEFQQKLFQLFDLERNGHLLQDRWIEHIKGRLTDDRQMDFAEQIESVAYVICGENSRVSFKNFRDIWHTRGILDKLYRLIDMDGTNLISTNQVMEFISHLTNSRPRTGFDKSSLARLEQLFRNTVGNEQEIRREEFQKIVTSKNPFFTERVFQIFDKDNSGSISLQEFIDAIHQFSGQSADDKIRFLFKVYDIDGDGLIQHKELHDVIRHCIKENGMEFSEDQIEDLTSAMFEDADPHNSGEITYEALKNQLHKHGGLLENLSITIDRWLVPVTEDRPAVTGRLWNTIPHQLTLAYMKNNQVFVTYLFFYIAVNLCLFISRAIQYRASNGFVIIARACGQCLNFNCAWVLVLMLRHSLTYLRGRGLSSYLPLDHHVYLHKLTGITISVLSLIHTIMHLFNFSIIVINDPNINAGHYTIGEWLLTDRPGLFGLIPGCANPTGVALLSILVVMFVCSQPFVRRKGSFEVFYWTHLLYVPFWILTLFHGPNFWKWFLLPGLVYIVERVLRYVWMRGEHGKTYISSGLLLPSKVIHLVIKRPFNFNFRPGDYVFVNIPAIANYEWHPFTISSAPEQEDYMWLHIRTVGEWTNRLYRYFEREQQKLHKGEVGQHMHAIPTPSFMLLNETRNPALPGGMATTAATSTPQTDFLARNMVGQAGAGPPVRPPRQHRKLVAPQAPESAPTTGVNRIRSIKKTLQRTFSRKEPGEPKSKPSPTGMLNGAFIGDGEREDPGGFKQRPLEKSISLPDISVKIKKRSRLKALRALGRSESERTFDDKRVRRARNNSVGLAYLSPQNKSLAQSFRYMRNKPTIIAFKTPSMEEHEGPSQLAMAPENSGSLASRAEQGQLSKAESSDRLQMTRLSLTQAEAVSKPLEIFIDGPYGAPSSHIFGAQHAVLIGTGIGVTPFASILQSIMHRYWKARHSCPRCQFEWASEIPKSVMNLRKVDFFWINRDQRSFEWFVNLLSQLEIEQAELGGAMERFLDMHMYITSALQRTDMKAVGLQLALDLLHEKGKRDLITGLKTRTNAGRPNWDKVFKQLQAQQKGKVTVFYCGPPQLAKTLRYKCDQYGFSFRKECF
ncbi:NADPH oxidase 5 isoform X2 [Drosophila guanche]|uniref:NADPH oxidase 5 isoform X2 n=1 Tax=Drosophila guanche TaxID=7266 RepID=UPI0014716284|nr:NADPH oxidase 5 isoform X2 [Drosophila guanche]